MNKFIYVFNEEDKNRLISMGFRILKEDSKPFIFANNNNIKADFSDIKITYGSEMLF